MKTNKDGKLYDPMNCGTTAANSPQLTKAQREKMACGDVGFQTYKASCPPHSKNILDVTCDLDLEIGRNCCCEQGYKPHVDGKLLSCKKPSGTKLIRGRVWLEDPKEKYPFGGVKRVMLELESQGGKARTFTDDAGLYEFEEPLKKGETVSITLYLIDQYSDGKTYIRVVDHEDGTNAPVKVIQKLEIKGEKQELDFIFTKDSPAPISYETNSQLDEIAMIIKHYMFYEDALDYHKDVLKADLNQIDVHVNVANINQTCGGPAGGCYVDSQKTIYIRQSYLPFTSAHSPAADWHEYGHAAMFAQFYPVTPGNNINHGGFLNPTTADSMIEAEAEFLALLVRNHVAKHHPGFKKYKKNVFDGTNFEGNPKPWMQLFGKQYEEYSVSSIFWDLLDKNQDRMDDKLVFKSKNPVHDKMEIPVKEFWEIIKQPSTNDVKDFYEALIVKYPTDKKRIDAIFGGHGFFKDTEMGDGQYNGAGAYTEVSMEGEYLQSYFLGEPFNDKNKDNVRQTDEFFIDMGRGHKYPGYQVYNHGTDEIGTAANGNRSTRTTQAFVQGSKIKVGEGDESVIVKVVYKDYPELNFEYETNAVDGLVYFEPQPGYETTINVQPSAEYESEEPFAFTSDEWIQMMDPNREYFAENEFNFNKGSFSFGGIGKILLYVIGAIIILIIGISIGKKPKKKHRRKKRRS